MSYIPGAGRLTNRFGLSSTSYDNAREHQCVALPDQQLAEKTAERLPMVQQGLESSVRTRTRQDDINHMLLQLHQL